MASPHVTLPVILLISANENIVSAGHLRNLREEIRRIRDALKPAELKGLCTVLYEANATADRFFDYFTDERYRNRIAIFHFAGHANEDLLMLESAAGGLVRFHAEGLAQFLGEQRGLQLVFLNGCSTDAQVDGLLRANCSAVIGTSRSIDDEVAMAFAAAFYREVGAGSGLASAFNAAVGATRAQRGEVPRAMYHGGEPGGSTQADRWPWALQIKPGAEEAVRRWNLPDAAEDPLFGLPPLPPDIDLPESPFRSLSWFEREHAGVFFGRAFQIREICNRITAADAAPILLVYGESGVGKSSLLAAGVLPRLESSHRVEYLRRDPALGLLSTLMQCLDAGADVLEMQAAWRRAETGKPLLVVLDQAEEAFTRPMADPQQELTDFFDALQSLFGTAGARPRGRLILGFRKEWLPEFEARLAERRLPKEHQFLQTLDRRGIVAAIEGPTRGEKLHATYGLTVDEGLAAEIADDLLADPESPVAPTLQILLTKLWHEAQQQEDAQPRFTRALYLQLKRGGILLQDFLDQQLAEVERWRLEIIQSGLALDLLAFHTTAKGTARQRTAEELLEAYAHAGGNLPETIRRFGYLMADSPSPRSDAPRGTRLAHDTLAPLVRERFEGSDRPGQRARRILENRAADWQAGRTGPMLDADDLRIVEAGATGMRATTPDEERLLKASRTAATRRRLWLLVYVVFAAVASMAIVGMGLLASWQWRESERNVRKLQAIALASEALSVVRQGQDPYLNWYSESTAEPLKPPDFLRALRLARDAARKTLDTDGYITREAFDSLREAVLQSPPWHRVLLMGLDGKDHRTNFPTRLAWSPSGSHIAAVSPDGGLVIWNANTFEVLGRHMLVFQDGYGSPHLSWCSDEAVLVSSRTSVDLTYLARIGMGVNVAKLPVAALHEASCHPSGRWSAMRDGKLVLYGADHDVLGDPIDVPAESRGFAWDRTGTFIAFQTVQEVHVLDTRSRQIESHSIDSETTALRWHQGNDELLAASIQCDGEDGSGRWSFKRVTIENGGLTFAESEGPDEPAAVSCADLNSIEIAPDLAHVATGSGGCGGGSGGQGCFDVAVRIFETATGHLLRTMHGHRGGVTTMSWRSDGKALVTGSAYNGGATSWADERILLWQIEPLWHVTGWKEGNLLLPSDFEVGPGLIGHRSESAQPTFAGWSDDSTIKVSISISTGAGRGSIESGSVVSWNGETRTWSWGDQPIDLFKRTTQPSGDLPSLTEDELSPPGKSPDGTRELVFLNRSAVYPSHGHEAFGYEMLACRHRSGDEDVVRKSRCEFLQRLESHCRSYGLLDGIVINQGDDEEARTLGAAIASRCLSGDQVRVAEMITLDGLVLTGHDRWISTATWNRDGDQILTSSGDGSVRIWDARTGNELARMSLKRGDIARATWSPNGSWVVSGHPEVRIWPANVSSLLDRAEMLLGTIPETQGE